MTERELEFMLRRVMRYSTLPTLISREATALLQRCPIRKEPKQVEKTKGVK